MIISFLVVFHLGMFSHQSGIYNLYVSQRTNTGSDKIKLQLVVYCANH